ncbi:hypothetical protein CXB51_016209 [Gossypium anomalum]|uniref:Uncharacterized protein n=1 Tax=Gossypium anomalum TaxID=47600 RepID=A0A8J5YFQ5_9ROSI|nr:hypothetical protein CXB51_016209 [Gossypium anomalum]
MNNWWGIFLCKDLEAHVFSELLAEVSMKEVCHFVFSMSPLKAPRWIVSMLKFTKLIGS